MVRKPKIRLYEAWEWEEAMLRALNRNHEHHPGERPFNASAKSTISVAPQLVNLVHGTAKPDYLHFELLLDQTKAQIYQQNWPSIQARDAEYERQAEITGRIYAALGSEMLLELYIGFLGDQSVKPISL